MVDTIKDILDNTINLFLFALPKVNLLYTSNKVRCRLIGIKKVHTIYLWMPSGSTQSNLALTGEVQWET